jgi:chromosome segregation ATPase
LKPIKEGLNVYGYYDKLKTLKYIKKWRATMEKNQLRRNEALAQVEAHLKHLNQQRAELSKQLELVEQDRNDLRETIDILIHQLEGLEKVLERANSPKVREATIDAGVEYSGRTVANPGATANNWLRGVSL